MYIFIYKKQTKKKGKREKEKSPRGPCDRPVLKKPPHPIRHLIP